MNTFEKTAAVSALLLALVVCAPTAAVASAAADKEAIRAAGDAWNKAYNGLNTDALLGLYAADAVLMPETTRFAKGHAAIRKFLLVYMALFADGGYTPAVANTVEIEVSGNLGFRAGTYSVTDKSGAVVDTGKWLETWRKTDGKWRITRDIWNSDVLPLFPPTAFAGMGGPSPPSGPLPGNPQ